MEEITSKEELRLENFEHEKNKLKFDKFKLLLSKSMLIGFVLLQLAIISFVFYKGYTYLDNTKEKSINHVAVINIDEVITDTYADKVLNRISTLKSDIEKNKNIKAVVIKLRSPGGSPSASWTISTEIENLNNSIPVYMYVDSAAVSGSYMIASQAKRIYSNPFAMVGSIGVILEHLIFKDISEKVGIGQETLTAGKYKKMISSFKYLNDEEKEYLETNLLNEIYNSFLNVVAKGRSISVENLMEYAEGKVFMATDKRVLGVLVDEVINWTDMKKLIILELSEKENIEFVVYDLDQKSKLSSLLGTSIELDLGLNNLSTLNIK